MGKIVADRFQLKWELPQNLDPDQAPDVVSSVLFFAATPEALNYDCLSVPVAAPKAEFSYPEDAPEGLQVPSDGHQVIVAVATKDAAGNLSDLVSLAVPFDQTAPAPVTNLRLVLV